MFAYFRRFWRCLAASNARTAASLVLSALLLLFVVYMFLFGQAWLNLDQEEQVQRILLAASQSPWAVAIVVSVFVVLALTGFPQILLIAATVIAFGGRDGAVYSWLATMISATVTFGLGRWYGSGFVERFGGERGRSAIAFIGRHGIVASALIRVVPSAPFIVVNAAAGAAHIPLWKYWAGTGAGIVPKILLVVALGAFTSDSRSLSDGVDGILDFFRGRRPEELVLLAAAIAAWLAFLGGARWIYMAMRRRDENRSLK